MKAVVISEHGSYDKLRVQERPDPEPGPGEVRVRVRAVSLNHLDAWVRRGVPGHEFPLPLIPGSDFAGEVDALGPGVDELPPGQRVVVLPGKSCGHCAACLGGRDNLCRRYEILGESCDGGDAELAVVPAANIHPLPDSCGFVEAASVPLVFQTAWHMLLTRAKLEPGEEVLIHAAGSGVSIAAIQIAKMLGCKVIVTAGSDAKLKKAKELGADAGINYTTEDFAREVRTLTGKRGVDVVVDHVGEMTWDKSVRCLARGGRLVTCGATTGARAAIDLRVLFFKNISLLGSTMGSKGELHQILPLVFSGRLVPVVAEVLPLDQVARAHELLESREVFGKLVLEVGS